MIQECHLPLGQDRVSIGQGIAGRTQVSGPPMLEPGSGLVVTVTLALLVCSFLCHQILQAHLCSTLIIYVSLF